MQIEIINKVSGQVRAILTKVYFTTVDQYDGLLLAEVGKCGHDLGPQMLVASQ